MPPLPDIRAEYRRAPGVRGVTTPLWRLARYTLIRSRLRRRAVLATILVLVVLSLVWPWARLFVVITRYKVLNDLNDDGWMPCGLRKEPMLHMVGTNEVLAVWEANCHMSGVRLSWSLAADEEGEELISGASGMLTPNMIDDTHQVYRAVMGPLTLPGTYRYEVTAESSRRGPLAAYTFPFFPPSQPARNSSTVINKLPKSSPIRIVAMADNQFGLKIFDRIVRSASWHRPHLLLHAGDAVQQIYRLQQWQTDFCDPLTYHGLFQRAPMIYAHGNHDYDPRLEYTYTGDRLWHAFTSAGVRWIVLDSNMNDRRQDEWLARELSSPESREAMFRAVIVHIPPFLEYWDPHTWNDKGEKHWGEFVRERFVPIFREGGVDLVISGHQHNYERGRAVKDGIVYAIIGGAGGDLDMVKVEDWGVYYPPPIVRKVFHYVVIRVWEDEGRLEWTAYGLNGDRLDAFELKARQT